MLVAEPDFRHLFVSGESHHKQLTFRILDIHGIIQQVVFTATPLKTVHLEPSTDLGESSEQTVQVIKDATIATGQAMCQGAMQGNAEEVQDALTVRAGEAIDIADKSMERVAERFQLLLEKIRSNKEYTHVMLKLMDCIALLFSNAQVLMTKTVDDTTSRPAFIAAVVNARQLLEHTSGQSLTELVEAVSKWLTHIIGQDSQVAKVGAELHQVLRASLEDPVIASTETSRDILEKARTSIQEDAVLRDETRVIVQEAEKILKGLANSAGWEKWEGSVRKLVNDLVTIDPETGKPMVRLRSVKEVATLLVQIAEALVYVPLPRIEHEDAEYKVSLDNILLHTAQLLPTNVSVDTHSTLSLTTSEFSHAMSITATDIHLTCPKIAFSYLKKRPFPLGNTGFADTSIIGDVTIRLSIEGGSNDAADGIASTGLVLESVRVAIKTCDVKVHGSGFDRIYAYILPLIQRIFQKQLEIALEGWIAKWVAETLDALSGRSKQPNVSEEAAEAIEKFDFLQEEDEEDEQLYEA